MKDDKKYIAIDPGLNNVGICLFKINKDNIEVIDTWLVNNIRKFTPEEKVIEAKYASRFVKVLATLHKVEEICKEHKIEHITVEAPFYNKLTPVAYGALLEVINIIKYRIAYPADIGFSLLEPLYIKKVFSNYHLASKTLIKEFLVKKKEDKTILIKKDIELMSEHEVDAVAIAFSYVVTMQKKEE